ncbi:hypothetical protein ACMA1I_23180 [Pontibacter sp. 13R65]|uniref:hypothetical protein n=1 Tax=Pontibacter sp. 13R65 TaxID=3127458 RepID=UPI00301CF23A
MKLKITKKIAASFLLVLGLSGAAFAQNEEKEFFLNPKEIPPQEQGYMLTGVVKDGKTFKGCGEGDNGNGTEHNAPIHNENGAQGGFTFEHVSIMTPNCNGKGTPDPGFPTGYIQLREFAEWQAYVDEIEGEYTISNITSGQVTNIKSLTILAGSDVSINANRSVVFGVEVSEDGGETWEYYMQQILRDQGGRTYEYTAGGDNPNFNAIATLSQEKPIMIRIIPWKGTLSQDNRGQRLKVHGVKLVATEAVTSSREEIAKNEPFFEIEKNSFIAKKEALKVYNMVGALVGAGKNVTVPGSGLYIVRSENGLSRKVFLQ